MTSLFSKPSFPDLVTPDNSAANLAAAAARERLARGRAANILTTPAGLASEPVTSSNVLLGS